MCLDTLYHLARSFMILTQPSLSECTKPRPTGLFRSFHRHNSYPGFLNFPVYPVVVECTKKKKTNNKHLPGFFLRFWAVSCIFQLKNFVPGGCTLKKNSITCFQAILDALPPWISSDRQTRDQHLVLFLPGWPLDWAKHGNL